jgi:hypothetical protein
MTGTIRATANDILNQVGVEVGLDPVTDPFSASDQSYKHLKYLINTAGEELSNLYPWDFLRQEATITTQAGVNEYDLPADFLYMMNQTMWDRTNDRRVIGPLTPQEWSAMKAMDTASVLNYGFRLTDDKLLLWPDSVPAGLDIRYEYISRNWVLDSETGTTYIDECVRGADTPQFNRTLIGRMLKVKFLEAKGFDTTKAQADLNQAFAFMTARNKGAPVLNMGRSSRSRFLNGGNIPETGYGG